VIADAREFGGGLTGVVRPRFLFRDARRLENQSSGFRTAPKLESERKDQDGQ
jgi:hypothetical protein